MLGSWMSVFLRVEWEAVREREVRASMPPGACIRRLAIMEDGYEILPGQSTAKTDRDIEV